MIPSIEGICLVISSSDFYMPPKINISVFAMQIVSLHRQKISIDLAKAAAAHRQPETSPDGETDERSTQEEKDVQKNYLQTVKEVTA
jgi:hypothetical protein